MKIRKTTEGKISIHALREEGDIHVRDPTLRAVDISIHALREEGDTKHTKRRSSMLISIHALREEGDDSTSTPKTYTVKFLSTPSARRATGHARWVRDENVFLSTPSARRATGFVGGAATTVANFYPRPPRGGRPFSKLLKVDFTEISIHALREEGDWDGDELHCSCVVFLSTPSARRATSSFHTTGYGAFDFYPRPPRGGRLTAVEAGTGSNVFLSTPSARRATAKTETKSLFSNKLYNILHEFRRALIYNGSKNYPNHAK